MAIDTSGQESSVSPSIVKIFISGQHPLIQLANSLPWKEMINLVLPDLKSSTKKGYWWMGPKLKVRIHLSAYILQKIYNYTDRKTEYQLKDNAAVQLFCGLNIVEVWHAPDHTKIEEFRNRISPETQKKLANMISQVAVTLGFADPRDVDLDSTVQEANIAYPSDASLMSKLAGTGKKVVEYLKKKKRHLGVKFSVDLTKIKKIARKYFFLPKNKSIEIKREIFKDLHKTVKAQIRPVVNLCNSLSDLQIQKLPWNIERSIKQLKNDAWRYLLDVGHFVRTHTLRAGKILSFHAKEVSCIKKGKMGKEFEFGRVFQLGRLKGNFLFVVSSMDVEMNDKKYFHHLLQEHMELFGERILKTVAADKGYWSQKNAQTLKDLKVSTVGLACPYTVKQTNEDMDLKEDLQNRRSGIEPLIGHLKHGGQMGRSRMKSDAATLAAGYGSVLGFNLRQVIRYQQNKMEKAS
jgi:IS5 family transposase